MKESEFAKEVKNYLERTFPQRRVNSGVNLQHSIIFGSDGEV